MKKTRSYIISIVTIANFLTVYAYISYYYLSLLTKVRPYSVDQEFYNEYRHIVISMIMLLIAKKISNKFLISVNLVSLALVVCDLITQYYYL